jgi:hypothetical protein
MKRKAKTRRVQRPVQRAARSDVVGRLRRRIATAADPHPKATSEAEAPTPRTPGLDTRFKLGNSARTEHWVYSERLPPGLEHLPAQLEQFMAAQLADEGDEPDRLSARRRSLLSHRVFIVERNIAKLAHGLEVKGLCDSKGKLRVAWLQMLGTFIDKAIRLDSMLGLERRARTVKQSTREWLLDDDRNTQVEPGSHPSGDSDEHIDKDPET